MMKYGKEITAEICTHISLGLGRTETCRVVGIHYDTFYDWLKKKPEFEEAIKKAEALQEERNLALIQSAAKRDWKAAAWLLERKYPQRYSQHIAHSNPDGSSLNLHQAAIVIINSPEALNDGREALPAGGTHQLGSPSTTSG